MKKAIILDEISIDRKIKRLSYEIYERNLNKKKNIVSRHKKKWVSFSKADKKRVKKNLQTKN